MQVQIEKPKETKQLKIGIVGPSKPQWKNPEQYERMKEKIKEILLFYISSMENPRLDNQLIVVSGHCPVGEEKPYCVTCGGWLHKSSKPSDDLSDYEYHRDEGHIIIKVYDQGGVDTEAEIIAAQLGVKTEIYPAKIAEDGKYHWEDRWITKKFQESIVSDHLADDIENRIRMRVKGFRSRNIQIAESSNIIYCLVPENHQGLRKEIECPYHENPIEGLGHPQNGGCWTIQYAKKLGKEIYLVVIK